MSPREHQVKFFVLKGLSNRDISRKLHITEKTVKFHLTNIFVKEKVSSRLELAVKGTEDVTVQEINLFRELMK